VSSAPGSEGGGARQPDLRLAAVRASHRPSRSPPHSRALPPPSLLAPPPPPTRSFLLFIWATGDGSGAMAPDQETICYAVADILGKVVFGFVLVFSGAAMDAANGITSIEAKSIV
jgi:hypothetical protein